MNICFQYDFHPVGQGLFASGCLYPANTPQPWFLWVYDCGSVTHKTRAFWARAATDLKVFDHHKNSIDLLTLSHFDDDHIEGVTALLGGFDVEVLLLPYVPLWRRLAVAFGKGISAADQVMAYYVDPVAYFAAIEGATIRRVIIVGLSEGEGPPVPEETPDLPDNRDDPPNLEAKTERLDPADDTAGEGSFGSAVTYLELLRPGQALRVRGLWEFCPYNSPVQRRAKDPAFRKDVESLQEQLIRGTNEERTKALHDLKTRYDKEFGPSSVERNIISLFLYAGPLYATWKQHKLVPLSQRSYRSYPARYPCYRRVHPYAPGRTSKCSLLYSGDGYLDDAPTFDHLFDYLKSQRMCRLGIFQVNHHGAKDN